MELQRAAGVWGGQGYTGNAAMTYRGAWGTPNVGYSRSNGYNQLYYGLSGGMLLHENGLTLSQPLSDTSVLIKAPGAKDVKVENQVGVGTDWRGYAVVPYATDYRENRVALNTNSLPENVELDDPVASVIPTRGAVVRADFKARVGMRVLMTLMRGGKPVPFGAMVSSGPDGESGSIVAERGQVYLSGLPMFGQVTAKWGDGPQERCMAPYRLAPSQTSLSSVTAECR